jgi:ubiquinone/menaquinone biosynthesis C-methylase UbiE
MLHSEEYLNDARIEWYNPDFLELIGKRLGLKNCSVIADVGCGLCHWSRVLVRHLKSPGVVYGIDREEEWLNRSLSLKATFAQSGFEINFINSSAESIALPDESCDLVTCQTLLIHVSNIENVLSEFYRILKPGGLVLCSEPNNLAGSLIIDEAISTNPLNTFYGR